MRVAKICNDHNLLAEAVEEISALEFCISMIESVLYEDETTLTKV